VAYTDGIECPGCNAQLEVSAGTRSLATAAGLIAATLVWRLTETSGGMLGWVLPVVYAVLAFSVVAALFIMATADLRSRPAEPGAEPVPALMGHGHGGVRH
jgi:hypothetical protein